MKNANVRVLVIAVALIGVVVAAAALLPAMQSAPHTPVSSERVTVTPQIPKAQADAQAYVRIRIGGETWPLIPLTDGGEYTISQSDTGAKNVLRTTATGAVMHFSTCDNQNCVDQREITLQNRETRVMGSLIVCLPNQVVVELLSAEEVQ